MYMSILILKILLALVLVQALVKFTFFFLVKYETGRRMLDSQYAEKTTATKRSDLFLFGIVVLLLILLFASDQIEYISFGVGLYAGMTLIQTYFHEFSKPLAPAGSPSQPVSPIKIMSYAIRTKSRKALEGIDCNDRAVRLSAIQGGC